MVSLGGAAARAVITATANQQQSCFQSSVRLPIFFRADVEYS
ncbi:hypothetical protein HY29_06325 [Hyphomonas beringensis]|uniref:Uncharacterized protein n=1 Tax=Hyphomonas beringensis TaxID=1280946 RepID=A0A062TZP4_9PROT|nr:hypothetical protein HY29_06325 [Hyphomonas beringensis]